METVNFHVDDDFKIKVGKKGEEIKVPRLLFRKTEAVLSAIANILVEDSNAAFQIIQESTKIKTVLKTKAFESFSKVMEKVLPKLIVEKNLGKIKNLLFLVSDNVINDGDIEKMQYTETCDVLSYLLTQNFLSLKNLSASLQAIGSSVQSGTES